MADSLSGLAVPELRAASRIADLGSGSGFPGLPLAIALPHARVDLIEASRRKCVVVSRLAAASGASNARAVPERAESWGDGAGREAYDAVTARALAPLAVLVEYASPLLAGGGVLVAWKGRRDLDEERAGDRAGEKTAMKRIGLRQVVPFEGAEHRHLVVYAKAGPTPPGLPRRPGMAKKRPLA